MAGKKKVDVVAVGGTVKYEKKYRVPGTDSSHFKCDEETAATLRKSGVIRYAEELSREEEVAERAVEEKLPEVTLELLKDEYPVLVKQIEEGARDGLYTKEDFDQAVAAKLEEVQANARDGYISSEDHQKIVDDLNGDIANLKKQLEAAGKK